MEVQEVLLRAITGKINWYQAAEILGFSVRTLRRWKKEMEELNFGGRLQAVPVRTLWEHPSARR